MQRRLFMRRLALTLFIAATIALPACANGYGGSSLGSESNQPTSIVFTNSSGSHVSFFKVAPDSMTPLAVTAAGGKDATFTWSIRYGTTTDTYQLVDTRTGLITYPSCPAVPESANAAAGALVATVSTVRVLPSALATPAETVPPPVYCLVLTARANKNVSAPVTVLVSN